MGKTERPVTEEEVYTAPRKGGVMNKLYPPGPKPGAGGRVKNHCRKFWWCGKSYTAHYARYMLTMSRLSCIDHHCLDRCSPSDLCRSSQESTEGDQCINA